MIEVTRLDGKPFTINADMIELIESNPDTFIRLTNGTSFVVREAREEVVNRVIAYRQRIFRCGMVMAQDDPNECSPTVTVA